MLPLRSGHGLRGASLTVGHLLRVMIRGCQDTIVDGRTTFRPGDIIPFGAGVHFKLAKSRDEFYPPKMNPMMELGIFMGYHMPPDEPWEGDYYVLHLEYFVGREFHRLSRWSMISLIEPSWRYFLTKS